MTRCIDEPFLRSWGFTKHNEDSKCVGFIIQPVRTVQLPTELHVDIFEDGRVEVLVAQSVGAYKHYVRLFDNLVSVSQAEMLFRSFCLKKPDSKNNDIEEVVEALEQLISDPELFDELMLLYPRKRMVLERWLKGVKK